MSNAYHNLAASAFTQDWLNTGLISTDDNWDSVPSIIGYRGDDLTSGTGTDPQTIVADGTGVIDVNANQTNPNIFTTGGTTEFEITNPVVALTGSGTADAPFLLIHLNTTGVENVTVSYNLRDLDGSADNSIQQVALQYRIGESGNFTNVSAGYVSDASTGPNLATQVTPVNVTLPAEVVNQPQVQVRIITTNAAGNDEWIGIDDIVITGTGGGDTPTLSISNTTITEGNNGTSDATFTVTRSGDVSGSTTVDFATADGTATANSDYNPTNGTLSFAAGETTMTITVPVQGDTVDEDNENFFVNLSNPTNATIADGQGEGTITDDDTPPPPITRIYDIQGAAQTSSLAGQSVTTTGIVTAVDSNGFYLQDPTGDGDIATSDGIFVFTSSAPGVNNGDQVQVAGTVSEFTPGGAATGNLSTTQITASTGGITTLATGILLPAPVVLGVDRTPPTEVIDDDQSTQYNTLTDGTYEPTEDGIDFYESLEGMRVTVNEARAVSPTNGFGEIFTVVNNGAGATGLSTRGTINISPDDFNPERIQIDDDSTISPQSIPQVNVGAQLGDVTGVISYNFGNFEVIPTELFTPTASTLQPETSNLAPGEDQLTLASYNVLNLDPNDADGDTDVGDGRFNAIADQIVNNLNTPDIIGFQEIQDNDGSASTTETAANLTLQTLIDAITAAGGPDYAFIDNTFIGDDTNGGEPGGNIRTAFLYNPDRVGLVADSVRTITNPADQQADSRMFDDYAPGRNPFLDSRLPLAATFTFNGEEVTVVDNHFTSKGGSSPLFGRTQPTDGEFQEDPDINGSLDQRRAQAEAVNEFVEDILLDNSNANVVVQGDLNEFEFISPLDQILEQNLTNLTKTLPEDERYSFIFDGNSQALDHILVSDSLADSAELDEVHVNSEFAETDQRASDHDPSLASFTLGNRQTGTVANETFVTSPQRDIIEAGGGNDKVITRFSELQQNDRINGEAGRDTFVLNAGTASDSVIIEVASASDQLQGPEPSTVTNFEIFDLTNFVGSATFNGSSQRDSFRGGAGSDTITGNGGNDFLRGGGGVDDLFGGAGNDTLDGGAGNDTLDGGAGNDIYIVNSRNDQGIEATNSGIDLVRSFTSFTLSLNVENLTLVGNGAINGTGNNLNNTLVGNTANNSLKGGAGQDTLLGSGGNDTLAGDAGNDTLTGSPGNDRFLYNTGRPFQRADVGIDNITDFSGANAAGGDLIVLDQTTFTNLSSPAGGPLQAAEFASVANDSLASGVSDDIVYSRATDRLFYNPNGNNAGFGSGGQFATLSGVTNLAAMDFLVQA